MTSKNSSRKSWRDFEKKGFCNFGKIINSRNCLNLQKKISKLRKLDKNIFYKTENEFNKKGRYHKYAPGSKDHNLLISKELNQNLDFIEKNPLFTKNVEKILGKNYKIFKKTIVRSVPYSILPTWIKNKVSDIGRPNLNPYIKDKFQDIQYFLNADFHQDMQSGRKFCTFYIYLDDVYTKDSYLQVLEGSHILGAQPYPHYLRKSNKDDNLWYYNDLRSVIEVKRKNVMGKGGTVSCWHGLSLHGTYYNFSKSPRISFRYLIEPNKKAKNSPFLKSFEKIKNKIVIKKNARLDINPDSSFRKTGMSISS